MQVLAAVASAADAADDDGGSALSGLIFPLLILLLIVYFFATQRRRAKAHQQQLSQITPGTLVMTTAGLYATVVEVDGADVLLEIAPDVVCRFSRNAVARVISTPDSAAAADGSADGADENPSSGTASADDTDDAHDDTDHDDTDEAHDRDRADGETGQPRKEL